MSKSSKIVFISGIVIIILALLLAGVVYRRRKLGQNVQSLVTSRNIANSTVTNATNSTNATNTTSTTNNTATNSSGGSNGGGTGGSNGGGNQLSAGDYTITVKQGSADRSALLHIPSSYKSGSAMPLVVALHGGASDAQGQENLSHMKQTADTNGFIVTYPQGINKQWNDGRQFVITQTGNADDVAFLKALVSKISEQVSIDQKRVYATGMSNGALMTMRLACQAHDTFAAFATVAGGLTTELQPNCKPTGKTPILMINGTADPIMPYGGGEITSLSGAPRGGSIIKTDDTIQFWVKNNGAGATPSTTAFANRDRSDGTSTTRYQYSVAQGDVVLLAVDAGGHTWPGGVQYLPIRTIGLTSRDFDASQVIWDFFKQYSR